MKWISDRQPKSPGMYGVKERDYCCHTFTINSFMWAYFDGTGWLLPGQDKEDAPYREVEKWVKIEWGQDEVD